MKRAPKPTTPKMVGLVKPAAAAKALGICTRTVRRWVQCGELSGRVIRGRVYVLRAELVRLECVVVPE
jgi:predicted site-specific integrase-resolvase